MLIVVVGFRLAGRTLNLRGIAGVGLVLALVGLVPKQTWRFGRLVVTAVHECGHAVAAVIAGRRVQAVHLRANASGVTIQRGGLGRGGRTLTAAAGYPAPGALGAVGGWLIANHHGRWWLVALAGIGIAMAVLWVRNLFGLALMLVWVTGLGWLLLEGRATGQALAGAVAAWYLVLGGLRAAVELLADRGRSDASDLARMIHVPTVVCKVAFAGVAAAAVAGCAIQLLGR
jgi:hypothetical protein